MFHPLSHYLIRAHCCMAKYELAALLVILLILQVQVAIASDLSGDHAVVSKEIMYSIQDQMDDKVKPTPQNMGDLRKAAERGDVEAQYTLGENYMLGIFVERDPVQSLAWFRKAAEQGNASAQLYVGLSYMRGDGVAQDTAQAVYWYQKAAEQGNAKAEVMLGLCYENGDGIAQDSVLAVYWYQRAAEQGVADAQFRLSRCYANGKGVAQDIVKAVVWLKNAAEQGNADAQFILGLSYKTGIGVNQDLKQAYTWLRKSAEGGNIDAQFSVAQCYDDGDGVIKDPVQAAVWYLKAADQGNALAHLALGVFYMQGRGVIQDSIQSCVHLLIASALGNETAFEGIKFLDLTDTHFVTAKKSANTWMEEFHNRTMKGHQKSDVPIAALKGDRLLGTGSGFVVSEDGYFLTCAHVIENGRNIQVQIGTKTYSAKLIRADTHNDVALLKLDGTNFSPLSLSQSFPDMGDKVFTVGFPNPVLQGASAKYTDGVISSPFGIFDDVRTMQITVPIQGGNSGGPLVDEYGNVLGIVVAQLNAATVFEYTGTIPQNVNFAVKINYALPIVQSVTGLAKNLPQPRIATPDARPVADVQAATGLVFVYE